jgi:hypothetical protein
MWIEKALKYVAETGKITKQLIGKESSKDIQEELMKNYAFLIAEKMEMLADGKTDQFKESPSSNNAFVRLSTVIPGGAKAAAAASRKKPTPIRSRDDSNETGQTTSSFAKQCSLESDDDGNAKFE